RRKRAPFSPSSTLLPCGSLMSCRWAASTTPRKPKESLIKGSSRFAAFCHQFGSGFSTVRRGACMSAVINPIVGSESTAKKMIAHQRWNDGSKDMVVLPAKPEIEEGRIGSRPDGDDAQTEQQRHG